MSQMNCGRRVRVLCNVWRRIRLGWLCLFLGLSPWLGWAASPPVWLDHALFDRLLAEVPQQSAFPIADAKKRKRSQVGVIGKGAHHKTFRLEVDRKKVLKSREERQRALKKTIRDFERKHGRAVKDLSLDQPLPDNPTDVVRQWLALQVEGQELEDEIRGLKEKKDVLYEEHTQVSTGENYWSEERRQWRPSKAKIEIIDGIGVARQGQQRVLFAPDLSEEGSVDISTPDGKRLKATVLGLAYVDGASGEDVVIANLKSTIGELAGSNQMIYRDAFDGVEADVVYTYRKSGLEQDVVLRSKIVSPAELGLNPDTTRLEVLTEWYDAPDPIIRAQTIRQRGSEKEGSDAIVEPAIVDEALSFGAVEIGLGRAFWRGEDQKAGGKKEKKLKDLPISANGLPAGLEEDLPKLMYPMAKHWLVQEGRSVLCEGVEYRSIESLLDQLPKPKKKRAALPRLDVDSPLSAIAQVPRERHLPTVLRATNEFPVDRSVRLAQAGTLSALTAPGLVLDYMTLNPATDFRFAKGETYRVTGDVVLSGTTVIEGGAVIKFERSSVSNRVQLRCLGNVVCETGPYRPAVFTAVGDGQYGSRMSYAPISGYYAQNALWIEPGGAPVTIEYVRIKHAINGVFFENSQGAKLRHSQLLGCRHPVAARYQDLKVENVLIDDFGRYAFWASSGAPNTPLAPGQETRIHAEHVTVHNGPWLAYNTHWNGQLLRGQTEYKNSLLVNINGGEVRNQFYPGDIGGLFTQSQFLPNVAQSSVFESVGYGNFYLPHGSPYRDAGGANIDPLLAVELHARSTTAPRPVQGYVSGALVPRAMQDQGILDLGYHYDAVDYALSFAIVRGDISVNAGTIVACTSSTGMFLYPARSSESLSVKFQGEPGNPVLCVAGDTVHEQSFFNRQTNAMSVSRNWQNSSISARYTDFYGLSKHYILDSSYWYHVGDFDVRHSRIFNAGLWVRVNPGYRMSFFNCLFETRDFLNFQGGGALDLRHCLVRESNWVKFNPDSAGTDGWRIENNVFDESRVSATNFYAPGFNPGRNLAIIRSWWWIPGEIITVPRPFPWQAGPLGEFYQPTTNNPLLDATYASADSGPIDERLTHHTVRADLAPEGNSLIDFGFHYVATDTNGNPLDDNLDGIPNYQQDTNSNGRVDNGEVAWTTSVLDPDGDEDNDGLTNYEETQLFAQFNLDPHNADSDGDGISDAQEDFDGDGLSNGYELRRYQSSATNARSLDPAGVALDSQIIFGRSSAPLDPSSAAALASVLAANASPSQAPPQQASGSGLSDDRPVSFAQRPASSPSSSSAVSNGIYTKFEGLEEQGGVSYLKFSIQGGTSGESFDLFSRGDLGPGGYWTLRQRRVGAGETIWMEIDSVRPSEFFVGAANRDVDSDGLPDGFELLTSGCILGGDPAEGDRDLDGDGLSNRYEAFITSDVRASDTDRDGATDRAEVLGGGHPLKAEILPVDLSSGRYAEISKSQMEIKASSNALDQPAAEAIDGQFDPFDNYWKSLEEEGRWLRIDLGSRLPLKRLNYHSAIEPETWDYPGTSEDISRLRVYLTDSDSLISEDWGEALNSFTPLRDFVGNIEFDQQGNVQFGR